MRNNSLYSDDYEYGFDSAYVDKPKFDFTRKPEEVANDKVRALLEQIQEEDFNEWDAHLAASRAKTKREIYKKLYEAMIPFLEAKNLNDYQILSLDIDVLRRRLFGDLHLD